jgi:hypothetical protein
MSTSICIRLTAPGLRHDKPEYDGQQDGDQQSCDPGASTAAASTFTMMMYFHIGHESLTN